ncbi:lumenal Hsp70 protein [Pichia californica]|uniref:Lumenal Hsp70 protein n=1 Tax=Pichia californica TaxID=460514 RepID=A0A9P6WLE2_9ASCO|nr:lumenal Hsp70 protein [[Candida] californica]
MKFSINFGTEYTKAILVAPGVPFDILLTSESKRKDVSGLALLMDVNDDGKPDFHRKFGTHALSTCIKSPQSCMIYLKPLLGGSTVNTAMREYSYKFPGVTLGIQGGRDAVTLVTSDKTGKHNETLLLEEVVGMTFLEIKNRALDYWKERSPETVGTIDEVVISVPRYFTEAARISLTDAAELAGLKVIALVDDGLSVALDYAQKRNDFEENTKEYHLIFDAGAGSTKLSLVSIANVNETLNLELENYAYSDILNGEFFTTAVRSIILDKFCAENGIENDDVLFDFKAMQKLWQASEKTKLILSANSETKVTIESLYGDIDFKGIVTRDELESVMTAPMDLLKPLFINVLEGFDIKKLNSIILAGGSSRVPMIQQALSSYLGSDELISKNVNADESVVFGTTLVGAQALGLTRKRQFNIIDRSSVKYDIKYSSANDSSVGGLIEVPKGILSDKKFSVNLTEFSNEYLKGINVEVLQNGDVITQIYNFTTPKRFNSTTCEGGLKYVLNYGFSKSDIFQVNSIKMECHSLINGTVSKVPKHGNMPVESTYFGFQPMPASMKRSSISRLNALETRDLERQKMSDIKNKLEGKLYELRYLLEEYESVLPSDIYDTYSVNVTEGLDWLDYESDEATLKDVETKLNEITKIQSEVLLYELVNEYENAVINLKTPYEELLAKKDALTLNIDNIINKDKKLSSECEKYGIDFESLVSKLHSGSWPKLETIMDKIDESFSAVGEGVKLLEAGAKKYEEIARHLLVNSIKNIEKSEKLIESIEKGYETVAANRKEFIQYQLQEAKKKLKKEKKAAASSEDVTSTNPTSTNPTSTNPNSTNITSPTTSSSVVHDEL